MMDSPRLEEATMIAPPGTTWAIRLGQRFVRLGTVAIVAALSGLAPARGQTPPAAAGVETASVEDIVLGSRILAEFGVVDAFGHVSARHPANPNHFLMSRSLA